MILDLERLDPAPIDCDLCIIGAGPAGISIALGFVGEPVRVCLLESGGLKLDRETQELYKGEVVGLPYWRSLDDARYRYFGGSTSRWGAWFAPLNEIDFSSRDWVPHSGWPISLDSMVPYYRRAQELVDIPSYNYDPLAIGFGPDELLPLDHEGLVHRVWQFGAPTRFGTLYKRQLKDAENIRVVLHANVVNLETDQTDALVQGANVTTLGGKRTTVRAKVFVLAVGGLEVPRVLLLSPMSNGVALGNRHDLVGRFFMEHPHVDIGTVRLRGDRKWVRSYQMRRIGRRVVRPHLCLSEGTQRRLGLINCSISLDVPEEDETSYGALRRLKTTIMDPYEHHSIARDFALAVANPLDLAYGVYSKLTSSRYIPRKPIPEEIALRVRAEQIPCPESRVTLSDTRDALGLARLRLDWRIDGDEKRSMSLMGEYVASELARLGLGEVRLRPWLAAHSKEWPPDLWGGPHHMGTARMHDDPKRGVVDRNCRVHEVGNLFIAGSAVFPTGGYANPTLTLVALAVRLADHLRKVLASPVRSLVMGRDNGAVRRGPGALRDAADRVAG